MQCPEIYQNNLWTYQTDTKFNWPKKVKLHLTFFLNKKSQGSWKKTKNVKFGLKKAKRATLSLRSRVFTAKFHNRLRRNRQGCKKIYTKRREKFYTYQNAMLLQIGLLQRSIWFHVCSWIYLADMHVIQNCNLTCKVLTCFLKQGRLHKCCLTKYFLPKATLKPAH